MFIELAFVFVLTPLLSFFALKYYYIDRNAPQAFHEACRAGDLETTKILTTRGRILKSYIEECPAPGTYFGTIDLVEVLGKGFDIACENNSINVIMSFLDNTALHEDILFVKDHSGMTRISRGFKEACKQQSQAANILLARCHDHLLAVYQHRAYAFAALVVESNNLTNLEDVLTRYPQEIKDMFKIHLELLFTICARTNADIAFSYLYNNPTASFDTINFGKIFQIACEKGSSQIIRCYINIDSLQKYITLHPDLAKMDPHVSGVLIEDILKLHPAPSNRVRIDMLLSLIDSGFSDSTLRSLRTGIKTENIVQILRSLSPDQATSLINFDHQNGYETALGYLICLFRVKTAILAPHYVNLLKKLPHLIENSLLDIPEAFILGLFDDKDFREFLARCEDVKRLNFFEKLLEHPAIKAAKEEIDDRVISRDEMQIISTHDLDKHSAELLSQAITIKYRLDDLEEKIKAMRHG